MFEASGLQASGSVYVHAYELPAKHAMHAGLTFEFHTHVISSSLSQAGYAACLPLCSSLTAHER